MIYCGVTKRCFLTYIYWTCTNNSAKLNALGCIFFLDIVWKNLNWKKMNTWIFLQYWWQHIVKVSCKSNWNCRRIYIFRDWKWILEYHDHPNSRLYKPKYSRYKLTSNTKVVGESLALNFVDVSAKLLVVWSKNQNVKNRRHF